MNLEKMLIYVRSVVEDSALATNALFVYSCRYFGWTDDEAGIFFADADSARAEIVVLSKWRRSGTWRTRTKNWSIANLNGVGAYVSAVAIACVWGWKTWGGVTSGFAAIIVANHVVTFDIAADVSRSVDPWGIGTAKELNEDFYEWFG